MVVSVFNRVVVVIIIMLILAGAVITLLVATEVSTPEVLPYGLFESQLQRVADATGGSAAAIIAVSAIIALGMIALLFVEVIPVRKPALLLISSTEQGIATIDKDSVRVLAEKTVATLHYVRDIRCSIGQRTGGLLISCRASVALGTNIPEASAELQNKIKEAVEQFTGLRVLEVDVKAKYEKAEAKRLAVR